MSQSATLETLYCALVYLFSRHAMAPQPHLAGIIADHLDWIAEHDDCGEHPALRDTCRRLAPMWRGSGEPSREALPPGRADGPGGWH